MIKKPRITLKEILDDWGRNGSKSGLSPLLLELVNYDIFIYFTHIALMMETVKTSETLVNIYQTTRRNIPEDRHFHIRRLENLKSFHEFVP
jgi:hypothetical protein